MGPLALLDLVGLDVAQSIGNTIGADVPARIDALVAEGALGRKSGRGFYTYWARRLRFRLPGETSSFVAARLRRRYGEMFSGD